MARTGRIALAVLAALAAPVARAQWRTEPMVIPLEGGQLDVLAGTFRSGAGQDDLLVLDQTWDRAGTRRHHALLARQPDAFPIGGVSGEHSFRAGYLSRSGTTDDLADVAFHHAVSGASPVSEIRVEFGDDPANVTTYALSEPTDYDVAGGYPYVVSFLRLLPRPPVAGRVADVLALPFGLHQQFYAQVFLLDLDPDGVSTERILPAPALEPMWGNNPEAFPAWLSTTAVGHDLDDVAIGSHGAVLLYAHRSLPGAAALSALDLGDPIVVGSTDHSARPSWLPPTVARFGDVRGVASLDVTFDGRPDLVFAMSSPLSPPGSLVAVEASASGDPADLADPALAPWRDLALDPALQLPDPVMVRPLRLGGTPPARGEPAVAVWDRALEEVLVVTADASAQRLVAWRAPAPGTFAKDIRLADLVGSPAPDLVVVMENEAGLAPDSALVYPDLLDASPALAWGPGSPGTPARGAPHAMQVAVSDPDAATTPLVEWVLGASTSAPVTTGLSFTAAPDCTMPPPPLVVTVRATDELGVFSELRATLPVSSLQPALSVAGASPPGRLSLPPGGTTVVLDGVAATGCGAASWGGEWPPEATVVDEIGETWLRRTVTLPEAAYPALLADPAPAVSIATTDPGVAEPVVTLPLQLDGSGLVEVVHEADRATLGEGEVGVVRTRLRSRLSIPLAGVRVVDALSGLVPAGGPVVAGAAVAAVERRGAEIVLAALPAAPAEVTIELPVRAAGARGGSAVEARSSGGWLLTPAAAPGDAAGPLPGCGCGSGGSAAGLAALALALAARGRRRAPPAT